VERGERKAVEQGKPGQGSEVVEDQLGWTPDLPDRPLPPRILGEIGPDGPGPTLLVFSGVHGNEPAGIEASKRVLRELESRATELQGRVHFIVGNRRAVQARARFLVRDLNRAWTARQLERLADGMAESEEDFEQVEILAELDRVLDTPGPTYAVDLHTTSGKGGVFSAVGDTLENRALARSLPVPLVLGLEELVDGTLQDYLASRGIVSLTFESGQHEEPEAVNRAEAAIWVLLASTGILDDLHVPELEPARRHLARSGRRLPKVVELRHRHPIEAGDGFRMRVGFQNFQFVRRGDVVADDHAGPIPAPRSGRILMPLYQTLGEDGFFVVREFRVFWLRLSQLLRRFEADRFVHLLPGIRRDPMRPEVLVVNRKVARWYALQLMHLLGFRRHRVEGDTLVVLRQGAGPG
jgi:hypothetical protein